MTLFNAQRVSRSENETAAFARELAAELRAGDVLCLSGELGAGKTVFTRGLVEGLRDDTGSTPVKSPTYTILNIYEGAPPIHHFDFYRVRSEQELLDIGLYDYLNNDEAITMIEWADLFPAVLPKKRYEILITLNGDFSRTFTIRKL